jgi:hypothetical protein
MTPSEVRNAIVQRYLDTYDGVHPIALDNQAFTPPESATGIVWTRVSVQFTSGEQDSLGNTGNRKFIKGGFLYIQVFTPFGHATNGNDSLAEASLNLFEGVRLNDLWFKDGRIVTVGEDGEWYQQNVVLEFEFEAIK